jgi:integrase
MPVSVRPLPGSHRAGNAAIAPQSSAVVTPVGVTLTSILSRCRARYSRQRRRWASAIRARPASVFGPVDKPPCVRRVKQGTPSTHPILGDELRALRRLQQEQEPKSPFVFTSERGAPFTTAGFARMIERAGLEAKFAFKPHPHMLRHACGYRWLTEVMIPGRCRRTSGTRTSSTQFATLS